MNIVVFTGSPRKKDSYSIIRMIESKMAKDGDVRFEFIHLNELSINDCVGCMRCFREGEAYCPVKDDITHISKKLTTADGIIFASPVYAQQISGLMKRAVDRLSYMFHRPKLIAKPALTIATTEGGGAKPTQKYLRLIARGWGCNIVDSLSIISPFYSESSEFYDESYAQSAKAKIRKISNRFASVIRSGEKPVPSFYDIYMFNGMRSKTFLSKADYDYWQKQGWLESEYYYPTRLGPLKKLFGKALSAMIKSMAKRYMKKKEINTVPEAQG